MFIIFIVSFFMMVRMDYLGLFMDCLWIV
jgi:hypothetical protein